MKVWFVLAATLVSCTPTASAADESRATTTAATTAPATSSSATTWQSSYDEEALGKTDVALAELERLPEQGSYLVQLRRGWLLSKLGKNADAADAYARAIVLEPASVEARLGALPVLAALRRWRDIETTTRQILERDPSSYPANLRLAFALYSLGRYSEAEVVYRKLAALYPGDLEVKSGVGWSLLKLGKKREASATFTAILEVAPKHTLALEGHRASR